MIIKVCEIAAEMLRDYPFLRVGQAYFNALYKIDPDLANNIRGDGYLDPYLSDDNLPNFLRYILLKL